jgi:hemerythrin-like domain-containing protein
MEICTMKPTEILTNEHRVIEIVLDCLEHITENAIENRKLDRESAEQAVDFIRTFADKCHHGKEETHLFTAMVDRGLARDGGPIGQMLHEHEQGRAYVRGMADNISSASAGDADGLEAFSSNALGYVGLLRAHIQKEDRVLFPLADRMLNDDDNGALSAAFEQVESEHMGRGTHEKYIGLAKSLADRWGVSMEGIVTDSHCCGH